MSESDERQARALNGICPYFTMFPLDFPLRILQSRACKGEKVLDPFCGRGTTSFAARLVGLSSLGVDSNPVAAAITAAKLVRSTPEEIISEAKSILTHGQLSNLPRGDFWAWAYHPTVLESICRFRNALQQDCSSETRIALRGIILGALHGPKQKTRPNYFSNQCPRTYGPKPAYATRFWKERDLYPESVDVLDIIGHRAKRYYSDLPTMTGHVRLADSRLSNALEPVESNRNFKWVITSPPYYGMRTYLPDQWLRNWFLGGPPSVDYTSQEQLSHSSPDEFTNDMRSVWKNAAKVCARGAIMVIRFGGIPDRKANPLTLIKDSLSDSNWSIQTVRQAGLASHGRRQADGFLRIKSKPMLEYDIWTRRN